MDSPRIEEQVAPALRRTYAVRVAILKPTTNHTEWVRRLFDGVVPLFGAAHHDREVIGFQPEHYHIDWRFASSQAYAAAWKGRWYAEKGAEKALVVDLSDVLRTDVAELTLRRHAPEYPILPSSWQPSLEAAYADKKLLPGMTCPHRGAKLSSCQQADGCVRCPLHGLKWNVATGALVPLFTQVEPRFQP
jgi:hypothetical protein